MTGEERIQNSGGFSLVESMIAMFFVTFIVSQIAMISISAQYSSILARRITTANVLADEALEKSRNIAYNNLSLAIDFNGEGNPDEACVTVLGVTTCTSVVDNLYTRVRVLSPLPAGTALNVSKQSDIDVTVNYQDAKAVAQLLRVSTVVTRY